MSTQPVTRGALLASGGGFVVMLALGRAIAAAPLTASAAVDEGASVGPFVHIPRNGPLTFVAPSAEMGQGIYTAECQLFAEELHVELSAIRVVASPVSAAYANPLFREQQTGGSNSIRGFYTPLREAAASARERLIAAAAKRWDVDPTACRANNGAVVHIASGRSLPYGALADAAALEPPPRPGALRLTGPEHFRVIGKSAQRLDTPAKANGAAKFGIDVVRPGMKIAIMYNIFIGHDLGTGKRWPAIPASTTPPAETPRSPFSTASTSRRALTACTCPASHMRTPMPRSRPSYVTSTPRSDTQAHRLIAKASERHAPMSSSTVRQPARFAPAVSDRRQGARTTSSIRRYLERQTRVCRLFLSSGMSLTARVDEPDQQAMDLIPSAPRRMRTRGKQA